jgi:hypothetical protein
MMVDLSFMKSDSKAFSKIWRGIVAEVTWSGIIWHERVYGMWASLSEFPTWKA